MSKLIHVIRTALLSSAAAPSFFPAHTVTSAGAHWENKKFIDGGVGCNSPALAALYKLCDHFPDISDILSRVQVLSLATGCMLPQDEHNHGGGAVSWAKGVINAMFDIQATQADKTMRRLLGEARYVRWNYFQLSSAAQVAQLDAIDDNTVQTLRSIHNTDGYAKIDQLRAFLGVAGAAAAAAAAASSDEDLARQGNLAAQLRVAGGCLKKQDFEGGASLVAYGGPTRRRWSLL